MPELFALYAPNVNSYKRYVAAAGRRRPPHGASTTARPRCARSPAAPSAIRIEHRVPGADVNAYLGFAACIAGGLSGIERKLTPPAPQQGNIYETQGLPPLPRTLDQAIDLLDASTIARDILRRRLRRPLRRHAEMGDRQAPARRHRMGTPPLLRAGVGAQPVAPAWEVMRMPHLTRDGVQALLRGSGRGRSRHRLRTRMVLRSAPTTRRRSRTSPRTIAACQSTCAATARAT